MIIWIDIQEPMTLLRVKIMLLFPKRQIHTGEHASLRAALGRVRGNYGIII
jgi:hypothetical protein